MQNIKTILKTKFNNKKVGILGLDIENYALVKYLLAQKLSCKITICDVRNSEQLEEKYILLSKRKNISWKLGADEVKRLDGFDVLYRSQEWALFDPALVEAVKLGVKLSSPINLFFRLCPTKNMIGVAGTSGKSTTSALIRQILKTAGKTVWLGGKSGSAPFEFLNKIRKTDWVILELSSLQLEDIRFSPYIGVITNFVPEPLASDDRKDLNHHKTNKGRWKAEVNILKFQISRDKAILNIKLKKRNLDYGKGKKIFFEKSQIKSQLSELYNKENVAAAVLAAKSAGVKNSYIEKAVVNFKED
jgi:UDP-N-acetylmuramoylalanine--D-glutamate ligase